MTSLSRHFGVVSERGFKAADRAVSPTPWIAWVVSLLLALATAGGIVYPKIGLMAVVLIASLFCAFRILLRPLFGVVLALCIFPVYPLVRAAIWHYEPSIPLLGSRFWLEIILMLTMVSTLVRCIVRREGLRLHWEDVPPLLFVIGGLYGVTLSLMERAWFLAFFGIYFSLTPVLCYFVMRWLRPSSQDLLRIAHVFLASYAVLAVLSLLDYGFHSQAIMDITITNRSAFFQNVTDPRLHFSTVYVRMQSLLLEENVWGALSSLVSLFCLAYQGTPRPPLWTRCLFVLATLCILLAMSRGAIASWIMGVAVLLLLRGPHQRRILVVTLVSGLLFGSALLTLRRHDLRIGAIVNRVDEVEMSREGLHPDRVRQWENSLQMFLLHPAGTGLGTTGYSAMYTRQRAPLITDGQYFRVAVEQGVPGLITVILALGGTLWALLRHLPTTSGHERVLGMTLVAYLCGLCTHSVGANAMDYYYIPAVTWMLIGLFMARRVEAARQARDEEGFAGVD